MRNFKGIFVLFFRALAVTRREFTVAFRVIFGRGSDVSLRTRVSLTRPLFTDRQMPFRAAWDLFGGHVRYVAHRVGLALWPRRTYVEFHLFCCDTGRFSEVASYRFGFQALSDTARVAEMSDGPASYRIITREEYDSWGRQAWGRRF